MDPSKPPRHKHSNSTGGGGTNFTKYLPRATTFTVPNRPYSPGRTTVAAEPGYGAYHHQHHNHNHHRTSFSGPISIVPLEARQRKSDVEPTSPKVSCIGQVKRHKDAACRKAKEAEKMKKKNTRQVASKARDKEKHKAAGTTSTGKPPKFAIMRLFRSKSLRARTASKDKQQDHDQEEIEQEEDQRVATRSTAPALAPPIGQLRRFSSGRTALAGFDWRSANAAICPLDSQTTESPATKDDRPDDDEDEDDSGYFGLHKGVIVAFHDDDDACKIPHSAPMVLGGAGTAPAQPTRTQHQVNLWKRRTMAPPKPLQLNA